MASKLKKILGRKAVAFTLILSFVFPIAYLPNLAPRSEALLGIGDINLESIPVILSFVFESVGKAIAQRMLDDVIQSTIEWANTGFDGNPAFVVNPGQHFRDIASGAVGDYINNGPLGFLCSPFQAQVKLSLVRQYTETFEPQCTIEQIGGNFDNFINNFEEGGWDAWFAVTQTDSGNPYGAFLNARLDIDRRLAEAVELENADLDRNLGFRSVRECVLRNTPPPGVYPSPEEYENLSAADRIRLRQQFPNWDPTKEPGACLREGPVGTPGSVISAQLNKALGSGIDNLISADDIDSLASAFVTGMLQRYVFGPRGLFGDNSSNAVFNEVVDVDEDRVADGYDYDGDGELDICNHGLKDQTQPPSNENCILSSGAINSPYFIPICEDTSNTIKILETYIAFIQRSTFEEDLSQIWLNRTTNVSEAIERLLSTTLRYEIEDYDDLQKTLGKYSEYIASVVEDLIRNKDLGFGNNFARGEQVLERNSSELLRYLREFRTAIGPNCSSPDLDALRLLIPPFIQGIIDNATSTDQ